MCAKFEASIIEGVPLSHAHRINSVQGVPIVQAGVASIARKVRNAVTQVETLSDTVVVATSVYNTLQSWDVDETGYNFLDVIPGTAFPDGDSQYEVEYVFTTTPAADGPLKILGVVNTINVFSD